jgi:prepilin-type N-terminal cleavage/methylation domain-containing protein
VTRSGFALIEVLVAVTLLALGILGWTALLAQTAHTLRATHDREDELRLATRLLARYAVRSRPALVSAAGRRREEPFTVQVTFVTPDLVEVVVLDRTGRDLLGTSLYRPEEPSNAP